MTNEAEKKARKEVIVMSAAVVLAILIPVEGGKWLAEHLSEPDRKVSIVVVDAGAPPTVIKSPEELHHEGEACLHREAEHAKDEAEAARIAQRKAEFELTKLRLESIGNTMDRASRRIRGDKENEPQCWWSAAYQRPMCEGEQPDGGNAYAR